MSVNPEIDGVVTVRAHDNGAEAEAFAPVAVAPPAPAYGPLPPPPQVPPWELQPAYAPAPYAAPARARRRPAWVIPAAIALVGLIVAGALSVFLYQTTGQRDTARYHLATTQATLADTQKQLATLKANSTYATMFLADSARVHVDYGNLTVCNSYSTCRTAAQQALSDMQQFQTDRSTATVPQVLASSDGMAGDALSAGIAAAQEFITGMDNDDLTKIKDGGAKFDAAMLSLAKAESALASALK